MFYYEEIGEGKPIVLIHGLGCDMRLMKSCMEPIFENVIGYKRVYIDLLGMGRSDAPLEYATADKMLEALVEFIREKINDNFLLVGQSYGGYLARGVLSKMIDKVDGMMLLCPVIFADKKMRNVPEVNFKIWNSEFLDNLASDKRADFCEFAVVADENTYEKYCEGVLPGIQLANKEFINLLVNNYEFGFDVDVTIGEAFEKPSLIICGRQDDCVGYEDAWKLARAYSRTSFAVLDVGGHNLQIEQPILFEELMKDWLGRCS